MSEELQKVIDNNAVARNVNAVSPLAKSIAEEASRLVERVNGVTDYSRTIAFLEKQRAAHPDEWALTTHLASYKIWDNEPEQAAELLFEVVANAPNLELKASALGGIAVALVGTDAGRFAGECLPRKSSSYEYMSPVFMRGDELRYFLINELHEAVGRIEQIVNTLADVINRSGEADKTHIGSNAERKQLTRFAQKVRELHGAIRFDDAKNGSVAHHDEH